MKRIPTKAPLCFGLQIPVIGSWNNSCRVEKRRVWVHGRVGEHQRCLLGMPMHAALAGLLVGSSFVIDGAR